jgi:hypothetical protein
VLVAQTAPAVRVSIGEEFGMPPGAVATGKLIAALRALGFDYVFDTLVGAGEPWSELANGACLFNLFNDWARLSGRAWHCPERWTTHRAGRPRRPPFLPFYSLAFRRIPCLLLHPPSALPCPAQT